MKDAYRKDVGNGGEELVAEMLARSGWRILARNWRKRGGEIDIIALEGDVLVFVEVKTWPCGWIEDLARVINAEKRRRMIRLAACYLDEHSEYADKTVRFDVVFSDFSPATDAAGSERIRHIRDAFTEA